MKNIISIITPVYNSYDIMDKCINSLDNQTNKNFEVIFIDDCSKDDSYVKLKKRLKEVSFAYKLIQNEINSGPGTTRNNGIKIAQGNYLMFLDSDDYLDINAISKIQEKISEGYDCILFDYYKDYDGKLIPGKTFPKTYKEEVDTNSAVALASGSSMCKVYKKTIIENNNIKFPEIIRGEDLAFNKVTLSKCKKIHYIEEPFYYYYQNSNSIMHNVKTLNVENCKKAFEYIESNIDNKKSVEMIFIREYLYLIVQIMILQKSSVKDIIKFIEESIKKYPTWHKNPYIKYQPFYLKVCLKLIEYRYIFLLKIIFKLKR